MFSGHLSEEPKRVVSKRVVLADVPRNENRNEGTLDGGNSALVIRF